MIEPILSTELKDLLNYIKNEMIIEFPINTITLNYFILSVLDNPTCECYTILSKILTTNSINEFKGQISNVVLGDCQADIKKDDKKIEFSDEYDKLAKDITTSNNSIVTSSLLFNKIIQKNNNLQNIIKSLGISKEKLNEVIIAHTKINNKKNNKTNKKKNNNITVDYQPKKNKHIPTNSEILELSKNSIQMVELAKNGVYDNIIGFEDKIQEIFQILGKYDRNVVAIVGKNGVGKTTLVQKFVKELISNNCPSVFKNKLFLKLYDENISKFFINKMNDNGNLIVFLDNVENLLTNKDTELNNIYVLLELFKSNNICTIFCITENAYFKYFESRPEISRYIYKINVNELSDDELFDIIKLNAQYYTNYNNIELPDNIIKTAITLSKKFITNEYAPASVLNVIDTLCANLRIGKKETPELSKLKNELQNVKNEIKLILNSANAEDYEKKDKLIRKEIQLTCDIEKKETIDERLPITATEDDVKFIISKLSGIPITQLNDDNKQKLKNLYQNLTNVVIGQNEAVDVICKAVKRHQIGLSNPNKPCVSLMVGSTGVGKTFLAKRLAFELFGNENELVRLDMSEYSEKTSVTKLYGASSGYIGYDEGGILTESIKKKPYCVLLLDEIEKAHSDVFNVFLQIFDDGRLTDNKGNVVNFKNVIIIMTSNVGVDKVCNKSNKIGFGTYDKETENKEIILKEIKNNFKPEFINRIDNICYFNNLTEENLITIIKNEIKKIHQKVKSIGYDLSDDILNGELINIIYNNIKTESEYGARPIIREIQKQLEDKLTDNIINNNVPKGYIFTFSDIYNI